MDQASETSVTSPKGQGLGEKQLAFEPTLRSRQNFFELTHDSWIVRDKDGRIRFWNGNAAKLYGWAAEEAIGQIAGSLLKTKFPTSLAEIESKLYACGHWEGEVVQTSRDGRALIVTSRWSLEADEEGTWTGVLQVERDITDQRRLETELSHTQQQLESQAAQRLSELEAANEALMESQSRFQQMAEAIRDVFWLTNPWRTSIIYVNPAYEQIWGRSCQSLYANPRSWLEAVHPEDRPRMRQFFTKPISENGYEQSYRIVRPDTSLRWILDRGFPVRDRGGSLHRVVGIARDITERKELENEILAISEREQQRIGQDLHDDLCQQLVGIEFLCKALQQQLKVQPHVAKTSEIAGLIRAAIDYTRQLARGMAPLELQAEGLMRGLQGLATRTIELFHIECLFECTELVLIQNLFVGTHLYRIAQEAVTNSIKHGKATKIIIRLSGKNESGVLSITDNGTGFDLEPFAFGGLGLRIMRYRADVLGGTCSIESQASGGTTITCRFPITQW
jgi:PAS domain S-box-containing protein